MNILLINYEYPPIGGGASNASYFLAQALLQHGHNISVVTTSYKNLKGYVVEKGVHVYRIPALRKSEHQSNIMEMTSFIVSCYWHIGKIIKQQQVEKIIIFFTIPSGIIGPYISRRYKIPYIISLRGGDVPGLVPELNTVHAFIKRIRQNILHKALAVVANSEGLAKISLATDPVRVHVIPNGVDTQFYTPNFDFQKPAIFQFLFVGRFQPQKNLFFLLDQLSLLKTTTQASFNIIMVGDGPQKADLINYAEKLQLAPSLNWQGWLNKQRLKEIYQQAHCCLNPSLYEGMPNVLLEAMACGLPVIASNVAGNDTLVVNKETGYLFDIDKPEDFQKALLEIIKNPTLAADMGMKARKRVQVHFSWQKVSEDYLKLFENAI